MENKVTMWGFKGNTQGHRFPLNLQLFAEPTDDQVDPQTPEPAKTYTEEEVKELLQKEGDKRVTEALKKQAKQHAVELEDAKTEAAKLAQLSEEERKNAEYEKAMEQLKADRAALDHERLEMQVVKELAKEGLDASFASVVMGADAQASLDNIKALKANIDAVVENRVKEKLGGRTPETGDPANSNNPFAEKTFNLTQQSELYKKDPAKYRQLKNK